MRPPGRDCGDLIHYEEYLVHGAHIEPVWRIGAPQDTGPADRVVHDTYYSPRRPGRTDFIMDLKADNKVALVPEWTDEMSNKAAPPPDAVVSYTVDDPSVINLIDNGDGTWTAASTGALGVANIHGEASWGGRVATGDGQLVVVAGDAERFGVGFGTPEEVTPDF